MKKIDKEHSYFGSFHYHTNDDSTYQLLCQNAKYNRKHPTKAEELLWEHLRGKQLGVRFRRQHPVYDYIPDFVCLSLNLIIEVDGDYHLAEEQQLSDRERDTYLQHFGFHIIRFSNEEVLQNLDKVLKQNKNSYEQSFHLKTNLLISHQQQRYRKTLLTSHRLLTRPTTVR